MDDQKIPFSSPVGYYSMFGVGSVIAGIYFSIIRNIFAS